LYGRGGGQEDPRAKAPPRPAGQRTEAPEQSPGFQGFGFGDGGKYGCLKMHNSVSNLDNSQVFTCLLELVRFRLDFSRHLSILVNNGHPPPLDLPPNGRRRMI
jgi:hypothetical protein